MSRSRVLATLVALLLSASAYAAVTFTWNAAGMNWTCTATGVPRHFRCVSPVGQVIYLTGDTEAGCMPEDEDCNMEVSIKRDEGSVCWEETTPKVAGNTRPTKPASTKEVSLQDAVLAEVPCEDGIPEYGDMESAETDAPEERSDPTDDPDSDETAIDEDASSTVSLDE